ncbi:MAG TPA: hypothetical protein VF717_09220 [Pyrinomonadaceae bacterium]|jgi:hypothetical protein
MALDYRRRLGKIMAFESADGVAHEESFWYIDELQLNISGRRLQFVTVAHHDTDAYDAEKWPIAGASKPYTFEGEEFDALIARHPDLVGMLLNGMWSEALLKKDVGEPPAEDQPDTRRSFFEGAADAQ